MIGDDGCQVPVPAVVLLAASPLVRSIYALYCCPVAISVPTVSEDVLRAVVEIMKNGQAEMPYEMTMSPRYLICWKLKQNWLVSKLAVILIS